MTRDSKFSSHVSNSIPNVQRGKNDKLHFTITDDTGHPTHLHVTIPEGGYEIDAIEKFLYDAILQKHKAVLGDKFSQEKYLFTIKANVNTQELIISTSFAIDFRKKNSIGQPLGFDGVIIKAGGEATSNTLVKITTVDVVTLNVILPEDPTSMESHLTLCTHPNDVPPDYKISMRPSNVLYLPLNTNYISNITLSCV